MRTEVMSFVYIFNTLQFNSSRENQLKTEINLMEISVWRRKICDIYNKNQSLVKIKIKNHFNLKEIGSKSLICVTEIVQLLCTKRSNAINWMNCSRKLIQTDWKGVKMIKQIHIKSLVDIKALESVLQERWLYLQENTNAFRYKLNVQKQKVLDGRLNFLVQVKINSFELKKLNQKNGSNQINWILYCEIE